MVEANPNPGGDDPNGNRNNNYGPDHTHFRGCNCAEEMKNSDPTGEDLFPSVMMSEVECFNEAEQDSIQKVIRLFDDKLKFR